MGGLYKTSKNPRFLVSRKFKKFSRKSEIGLGIIVLVVIVLFSLGWIVNINQRECRSNKDCNSEAYCGTDFSCHTYPTIQKTVVQYNLFWPAVVIGIAIVAAALIFKEQTKPKEEQKQIIEITDAKASEEIEVISEPYYKTNGNTKNQEMMETYYKPSGNMKTP